MIAQEDKTIDKALSIAWQLTEDERIRDQLQRREDNEQYWNALLKEVEDSHKALEEKTRELEENGVKVFLKCISHGISREDAQAIADITDEQVAETMSKG